MEAAPIPGFPDAAWAITPIGAQQPDFLSEEERELYASYTLERRREEWLAGRAAAHAALGVLDAHGLSVLRDPEGAPVLHGPRASRFEVAITHGKTTAAAVAAPGDGRGLGLDWVDAADRVRLQRLADRVLKPREHELVAHAPDALLVAWGVREAVAKATRTGMFAYALAGVHLTQLDESDGSASVNVPGVRVRFWRRPDGHVVVVAQVEAETRAEAQATAERARGRAKALWRRN